MTSDASWVDSMPEAYNRCLGPALFVPFARHLAEVAAALVPPPHDVLELAAGTGLLTTELVAALPNASIVATDLNPPMVQWGAQHVPTAHWATADAGRLDYADASYDLVACQFGVMFFPDKPAAYAEAARVLRPGAPFVFTTWDVVSGSTVTAALVDSLAVVLPDDPPDFLGRVPYGYTDPAEIEADLAAGGMALTTLDRVVLQGRADSARAVAEGLGLGSPLRFELQERGVLPDLVAAIGDEMTRRLGPGPIDGEITALVGVARHPV